jgi:hypothetical protein
VLNNIKPEAVPRGYVTEWHSTLWSMLTYVYTTVEIILEDNRDNPDMKV